MLRWLAPAFFGFWVAISVAWADEYAEVQRLQADGQRAEALARADRYIAEYPHDPQMRFIKTRLLEAAGQHAAAEEQLVALTQEYPELPEPWNNLAVIQAGRAELAKARESLEQAVRLNPHYAIAWENLGDVQVRLAAQAYQKAQQFDGGNARLAPKTNALRRVLNPGP